MHCRCCFSCAGYTLDLRPEQRLVHGQMPKNPALEQIHTCVLLGRLPPGKSLIGCDRHQPRTGLDLTVDANP
jgi:hypothetical protein